MFNPGRTTPAEDRNKSRNETTFPSVDLFVSSSTEISKKRNWQSGAIVGIANGDNFDLYIFKRTGKNPGDGLWLLIGTTGAALSSWG